VDKERHVGRTGRPTKYLSEYAERAYKMCCAGATDRIIAAGLGVHYDTIQTWKKEHEEFSDSIKRAKKEHDTNKVEGSLLKRAMGFTFQEVTKEPLYNPKTGEPITDKDGKDIIRTTKIIKKTLPPDTGAAFIWLKNRRPAEWRDKQLIEYTGKDGGPILTKAVDLTDDELLNIARGSGGGSNG
jgi:hypothetical protein